MTEWLGLRDKVVVITGAAGGMEQSFLMTLLNKALN